MNNFTRQDAHLKPNSPKSIPLPNGIDANFSFTIRYNQTDWDKKLEIKLKSGVHTRLNSPFILEYGQNQSTFHLPTEYVYDILFYEVDELILESDKEVILDIVPNVTEEAGFLNG